MSSQEFDPTTQVPVREQIPHSGVHGFEKPVQEFDNTSLAEAEAQGLIETPATPEALVSTPVEEDTTPSHHVEAVEVDEQQKPSTLKKVAVGLGLAVFLAGVRYGTVKLFEHEESPSSNDTNTTTTDTGKQPSAPVVAPEKQINNEFAPLEPVILTAAEVATLEAGDSKKSHKILDAKLIPRIQEALDQLYKNGGSLSGLDLTALAPSNVAVMDLARIESGVSDGYKVQVCDTTPNVDGSLNYCDPSRFTKIEIGKPIEFWVNDITNRTDYHFASDTRAEIIDGNRLILTGDE